MKTGERIGTVSPMARDLISAFAYLKENKELQKKLEEMSNELSSKGKSILSKMILFDEMLQRNIRLDQISDIVHQYTGIDAHISVNPVLGFIQDMNYGQNAFVHLDLGLASKAPINAGNPVMFTMKQNMAATFLEDDMETFKRFNKETYVAGKIDLENDKVYGFYRNFKVRINLSSTFLLDKTPEELAALTLHEVGHYMTTLYSVGGIIQTNFVLEETLNEIANVRSTKERITIFKNKLETELPNSIEEYSGLEELFEEGEEPDIRGMYLVTTATLQEKIRSELDSVHVDAKSSEAGADWYVAKHGLHFDLGSALNKVESDSINGILIFINHFLSFVEWSSLFSILASLVTANSLLLFKDVLLVFAGFLRQRFMAGFTASFITYDDFKDRLERIRTKLITTMMKDDRLTHKQKKDLLKENEELKRLIANPPFSIPVVGETLYELFIPMGKRNFSYRKLNRLLERLAANELYVTKTKLDVIGSRLK